MVIREPVSEEQVDQIIVTPSPSHFFLIRKKFSTRGGLKITNRRLEDRKSLSVETEVEEADMRRDRVMNPSNFTLTSDDRNNRWIAKLV